MKKWIGLSLGFGTAVLCVAFYSWKVGIIFGLLFAAAGWIRIKDLPRWAVISLNMLWGIGFTVISVCASRLVSNDSLIMSPALMLLNTLCAAIPCLFLLLITCKLRFSFVSGTFVCLLLSTINVFVYRFRGNALQFLDLFSVGTAVNVAGQYDYRVDGPMAYGWILWLFAFFLVFCIPKMPQPPAVRSRVICAAALVLAISAVHITESCFFTHMWGMNGTINNGFYLSFYKSIVRSFPQKPDSYQLNIIDQIGASVDAPKDNFAPDDAPNIIVIMNESFADLSVLGDALSVNKDITPFLDSIDTDIVRGYALTSAYGGSTANAEFEFLTGSTMGFLPVGSVPYQQFVRNDAFSLAQFMRSCGYHTFATHPYRSSGWSRTKVYPLLGLNDFSFLEDYPQEDFVRSFVSDQEMYRYVLDNLDTLDPEQPQFIFGITMQNHSGYDYEGPNYTKTISLSGYSHTYPQAEQYLSLLHESDIALEYFLTELERCSEDTIVLFFGDHLPRIEMQFYEEIHGGAFDTLDEQQLQYTVPFFIWANYDIQEETAELTSLNYLGLYLLETAGLELPPFYQFQQELRDVIPAMNATGYYSLSEGRFLTYEEASGVEAEWLDYYAVLQYNNLFDTGNRSEYFFGQYLPD